MGIDFVDSTVESLEWAVDNVDHLANGIVNLVFRLVEPHTLLNLLDFFWVNRGWLDAGANKPRNRWRVAHNKPRVFGKLHLHEYIALKDALFDNFALAVFDFDLLLFGNECGENLILHVK